MANPNDDARVSIYLDQCYAASIGKLDPATADAAFRDLIQADANFKAAAQARLKSISPEILKRDHVSRVKAAALQRALA